MDCLNVLANLATIATLILAVFGYCKYLCDNKKRRRKLENYLKAEKNTAGDKGQRTILQIMRKTGLSENQILEASLDNRLIERLTANIGVQERLPNSTVSNFATHLLFEYVGDI